MGDAYEIEPSKIRPLPTQTTLLLVNQFIVQTTSFLNSFSETIEKKISKVSSRVTELEILLAVFEVRNIIYYMRVRLYFYGGAVHACAV